MHKALFPLAVFVVLAAACQSGQDSGDNQDISRGSAGEPRYEDPVRITPGEYRPPWAGEAGHARGVAAAQAEEAKPVFKGVINGFRLYGSSDEAAFKQYCKKGAIGEFPLVDTLRFGYLPPGTFAETPQYAGLCPDGSVGFVVQSFGGAYFGLTIAYEPGERAFASAAAEHRISPTTVGGRLAVAIRPVTPEGFGRSVVVFAVPTGLIKVEADGLPLSETLKIAEGVQCESC